MTATDDERLSGFVDGELGPADQAALERELATNPELAARLAHMRDQDQTLREAFSAHLSHPAPDRFVKLVHANTLQGPRHDVIDLGAVRASRSAATPPARGRWWSVGGAVAATLIFGVFVGRHYPAGGVGSLTTSAEFNHTLEATPSAQTVAFSSGDRLTPTMTFAGRDGGFCRQFVLAGAKQAAAGVACRQDGRWLIKALAPQSPPAAAPGGYSLAAGPENDGLDLALAKLKHGDALSEAAEAAVMHSGWVSH